MAAHESPRTTKLSVRPKRMAVPLMAMSGAAVFAGPRLAPFLDQEPEDRERGHAVDPPGAACELGQQAQHHDERKPAASDRLNGVRAQRAAAELCCDGGLRLASRYMTGIASAVTIRPGNENAWPSPCHRPHPAATTTYAASANSKPPAITLAVRSADSEKAGRCLSSTERRQISTPAEASSMRLSMPNAKRVMLCAAIPEATAMMASTIIHATVNHSRRNASRSSAARSGSEKSATRAGVSHSFCAIAPAQTVNP